jgi:hypothetical protein
MLTSPLRASVGLLSCVLLMFQLSYSPVQAAIEPLRVRFQRYDIGRPYGVYHEQEDEDCHDLEEVDDARHLSCKLPGAHQHELDRRMRWSRREIEIDECDDVRICLS